MDPIALQRQLRNNSDDLLNSYEDIKKWTGEMNQKEGELKSGGKTNQKVPDKTTKSTKSKKADNVKPKKKTIAINYSSWDKYDADAECAKLDGVEQEDSDENYGDDDVSEDEQDALQEACYQKEKGNQYVKQKKWDQAIECYTEAIKSYGYDAVYYANRALCYLKKENYKSAETDCTSSLQLDKTYVKAYQRRAAAREALGQLTEAKADLLKVFDYEPNNAESKLALKRIEARLGTPNQKAKVEKSNLKVKFEDSNLKKPLQNVTETQRPKSKFTLAREAAKERTINVPVSTQNIADDDESKKADTSKILTYWPSGNDVELVSAIQKPPHLRSKKPLKRIEILDGESEKVETTNGKVEYEHLIVNELKIVEKKPPQEVIKPKINKIEEVKIDKIEEEIVVPTNYVQFSCCWKTLTPDARWKYLSKINPKNLPSIFKESLETDAFSEIIQTLSNYCQDSSIVVYEYLLGLSNVKRFTMLVMFMSDSDTKEIKKLFEQIKSNNTLSNEDVNNLIKKYGF